MKKILYVLMSVAAVLSISSCKDFLKRDSLTTMDDNNYWSSENNVRMYINDIYGTYFPGYSSGWTSIYATEVFENNGTVLDDDRTGSSKQASGINTAPADNWYRATSNTGYWLSRRMSGPWNYGYIRKFNHLLAKLDPMLKNGILTQEQYNHWTGVARFFRAWEYSRFVESFGDIPLYLEEIGTDEFEKQYAARDLRTKVMDAAYDDFDYAMKNVRENDGTDYVNRDVVATVASRCLLFEGSWYTFHKNDKALQTCAGADLEGHAKKYLQAAVDYTATVMAKNKYGFNTDFRTLFGSLYETLNGKANEVILYRAYKKAALSSAQHPVASYANGDESQSMSGNLDLLEAFICNDGLIYNKSQVEGVKDWNLEKMVKTRDPRFEATFWDEPKNSATMLYIEKFCNREGVTYHYNGKTRPTWCASNTNENGFPCIRYAETVLNWLEAKCILADYYSGAKITDADLDNSINKIRQRPLDAEAIAKGVQQTQPLTVYKAENMNDPRRENAAIKNTTFYKTKGAPSPMMWEIMRERRMEFVAECWRALDIRRWGMLELLDYDTNFNAHMGGYVDLAAVRTTPTQQTCLKKTKGNAGFDQLTAANYGTVSICPFEGFDDKGSIKLGKRLYWSDEATAKAKGFDNWTNDPLKMVGFWVPKNYSNCDPWTYAEKNYLEPVCTDIINQYEDYYKSVGGTSPLKQTAGWE